MIYPARLKYPLSQNVLIDKFVKYKSLLEHMHQHYRNNEFDSRNLTKQIVVRRLVKIDYERSLEIESKLTDGHRSGKIDLYELEDFVYSCFYTIVNDEAVQLRTRGVLV